jgi:hypothetical protein
MTERQFDRIADAFMAEGPTVLPDRVLDAAFEEVHRTRQRRVLWRALRRLPTMNTYARFAVAAVAVIALGLLGLNYLGSDRGGVGGSPTASPSPSLTTAPSAAPSPVPSAAPSATSAAAPTAPPLTGRFTSPSHGYSIAVPEGWTTRPATKPWTTEYVDHFTESADLVEGAEHQGFIAVASQPLGGRTRAEWEADAWQIVIKDEPAFVDCPASAEPITIDGAQGIFSCDLALVTSGGRGYWIRDFLDGDPPWGRVLDRAYFDSLLATMKLTPGEAVDRVASPSPS